MQPHRVDTFKHSNDPLFIEKVRDIVGLYLEPPEASLKTPAIPRWLIRHDRALVRGTDRKWVPRGKHRSTVAWKSAIKRWLDTWNAAPRPFVWAKTADEIVATVTSYHQRIS